MAKGKLWHLEDNRLVVNFHWGQQQMWDSEKRFIFVLSGSQGGKTSSGPLWLLREMAKRGAGDYIVATPTFPLLKMKALPEFRRLFEHTMKYGTWNWSEHAFKVSPDGEIKLFGKRQEEPTRVIFGSATHPDSLESATAKAAWLDECGQSDFRVESWEAVIRRLAIYQGRVLATTTPYNLGWVKTVAYDAWIAGDLDFDVINYPSTANPMFPEKEFERLRRTLPEWKFSMMHLGKFERPAGLIYDAYFDEYEENGGHLVKAFDIPNEWPRDVGIDFGATNTATIWTAYDPEKERYYLYHESLEGGKTTPEHVHTALAFAGGVVVKSWNGGSPSEKQQRMDWKAAGISIRDPEISDVEVGIDRVIGMLKTGRLYVFDTMKGLRSELGTYSRQVDKNGNVTEKIEDKSTFHRLDALRYLGCKISRGTRPFLAV